jgi:hypothetical protein
VSLSGAAPVGKDAKAHANVAATSVIPKPAAAAKPAAPAPVSSDGAPNFKTMTPAQKEAYARQRIREDLDRAAGGSAGNGHGRR